MYIQICVDLKPLNLSEMHLLAKVDETHAQHGLRRLVQEQHYPEKCEFRRTTLKFLGQIFDRT